MRGVPRELIEHALHLDLKAKPINQRLPHFAQDKKDVMKKDIARLLDASFIKDVYHLEWLANPLLVLEKNKDMQKKILSGYPGLIRLWTPWPDAAF
jgi:hypothetical protein